MGLLFGQTYWPLWYTRVVSQSKEIVSFLGMLWPLFLGGLGVGQKFSEAIFNITRPVRLLSYPHFFCQGQNPAPFLAMPVFSLQLLHTPLPKYDDLVFMKFNLNYSNTLAWCQGGNLLRLVPLPVGSAKKKEHHFADYLMRFEMIYSHFWQNQTTLG